MNTGMRVSFRALGLALAWAVSATALAQAPQPVALNIDAPKLSRALIQLTEQTGLQLIYPAGEKIVDRPAKSLNGRYTPQAALDALLQGSGLTWKFVDPRTIAIVDPAAKEGAQNVRPTASAGKKSAVSMGNSASHALEPVRMASAHAADTGEASAAVTESGDKVTEVIVTSTRETGIVNQGVIPREENQAVRFEVIRREDIERSGATTMGDFLRRLTSNQQAGTTSQLLLAQSVTSVGNFHALGDQVNLRGLGSGQTLVMINGRRIHGTETNGPDISRIPLAAVERIEILPVSGSAMYGSRAVGGVINVIMRQNYRGTDLSTYIGDTTAGGAAEYRVDLFHGMSFNEGRTSVTASMGYQRYEELQRGQRDYDRRMLENPALQPGGPLFQKFALFLMNGPRGHIYTTSPLGLGIPSNPGAQYAMLPAGTDGVGLTPASFNATAGEFTPSTAAMDRNLLRGRSSNYFVMLNLSQALRGDALGLYSELTWREDEMPYTYSNISAVALRLAANDPRNPFRTNVTPGFSGRDIRVLRDVADLPPETQHGTRRTMRGVVGFKGMWQGKGGRVYSWALDGSWDRNELDNAQSSIDPLVGSFAGQYNLFRDLTDEGRLPASAVEKFSVVIVRSDDSNVSAINLRLNGDLLRVWGGPAKFSIGGEMRREESLSGRAFASIGEYYLLPGAPSLGNTTSIVVDNRRDVRSAYAEVVFPLVGENNRRVALYSLDVSAGARFEDYEDYESDTPPILAAKWGLTPDIALRATYAEGFLPPTVSQLSAAPATSTGNGANLLDPLRPGAFNPNYTHTSKGNPDLLAETAETWDAGLIITPRAVPGLTLNLSYFRYDKANNITSLPIASAILYYPELVTRGPAAPEDIAAGRPGPVTAYNAMAVNLARQFVDGVDANLKYSLPARDWGRLTVLANGTWTKRYLVQTRPDVAPTSSLGLPGISGSAMVDKKVTATTIWSRNALTISTTGTWAAPFESATTAPTARNPQGSGIDGTSIGGQWIMDVQADYMMTGEGWLKDTRFTVGALNVFDTMPDRWSESGRGFVSPFVDPRQRFVYLQLKKSF